MSNATLSFSNGAGFVETLLGGLASLTKRAPERGLDLEDCKRELQAALDWATRTRDKWMSAPPRDERAAETSASAAAVPSSVDGVASPAASASKPDELPAPAGESEGTEASEAGVLAWPRKAWRWLTSAKARFPLIALLVSVVSGLVVKLAFSLVKR